MLVNCNSLRQTRNAGTAATCGAVPATVVLRSRACIVLHLLPVMTPPVITPLVRARRSARALVPLLPAPDSLVSRAYRLANYRLPTIAIAAAMVLAGCGSTQVDHVTFDEAHVAQDVLALLPRATTWARSQRMDAVIYRIELRPIPGVDGAPSEVLYNFFSHSSRAFMTATSDPHLPWATAEPQDWPSARPMPMPLPPVTIDFATIWTRATAVGIWNVTSAVLEVNTRNTMPYVLWSIAGDTKDFRERGLYFDALTGERLYAHAVHEPATSAEQVEAVSSRYRGALRGNVTGPNGCKDKAIGVPSAQPVVCYDAHNRTFRINR